MKKIFEVRTNDPNGEHAQKITLYELTEEERKTIDEEDDPRNIREFLGLPRYDTGEFFTEAGAPCRSYSFDIIGKIAQTVETFYYNI